MLQVFGRLHPVFVHFPIALLIAALAAELLKPRKDGPSAASGFCLALGTLGALAAALSGWLFAAHDPPGAGLLLERHRWSGVGTAAAACVTSLSAWRWQRSRDATLALPTRLGLALTAALAGLSGHWGGAMVYGEGFALEPLRAAVPATEPVGVTPPVETPEVGSDDLAARPVDFLRDVRPILAQHCFECHGDKKRAKGDLKLTDMASVLARDPREAALVPGKPEESLLLQRVLLPAEHEDAMPPDGPPLAPAEIETLRRWIAEGAAWSAPEATASGG
jgi:uncharacterized membrane protein